MEIHSPLHPRRVIRLKQYITKLPGLVGFWPMWEKDGAVARNFAPDNFGSLNGAITGATLGQRGQVGKAYSFDGVNDSVEMGAENALDITGDQLTVFCFTNIGASSGDYKIIGNSGAGENGYVLSYNTANLRLEMDTDNDNIDLQRTVNPADSLWHMNAVVYNGVDVRLYYDGALQGAALAATGGILTAGVTTFKLGEAPWADGLNFAGLLQHAAVFNTALTAAQMLKLAKIVGLA